MRPDDIVRLTHMRDDAASALRFIEGRERADLDRSEMLLFARVRAVEVIGEAAAKVSIEGRADIPEVRWAAIVGMRNRLVHAYFDVDRDILWATVIDEIPPLKERLSKTLDGLPAPPDDPGRRADSYPLVPGSTPGGPTRLRGEAACRAAPRAASDFFSTQRAIRALM